MKPEKFEFRLTSTNQLGVIGCLQSDVVIGASVDKFGGVIECPPIEFPILYDSQNNVIQNQ